VPDQHPQRIGACIVVDGKGNDRLRVAEAGTPPAGRPRSNRSKRGISIDGMPSLAGAPDLISASGTLCLEKSVRRHSKRQPAGSASTLPSMTSADAPNSTASAINPNGLQANDAIAGSLKLDRKAGGSSPQRAGGRVLRWFQRIATFPPAKPIIDRQFNR
jgi:hypothetical protein